MGACTSRARRRTFKIFNARFTKFLRAGIEFQGDAGSFQLGEQMGVIYRNEFIDNWYINLGYGVAVDGSVKSWNRPIALGTANAVFVEDNLFVLNRHCVTATNGANYVARYNTVKDNYQDAQVLRRAWPFPRLAPGNEKRRDLRKPRDQFHHPLGRCWNPGRQWRHLGQHRGTAYRMAWWSLLEDPPPSHPLTAYPALDQIGNPDDLYIWNNTSTGDSVYKNPTSNSRGIDYWLTLGRDYFTTAKPGYRPYAYPHPLRAIN